MAGSSWGLVGATAPAHAVGNLLPNASFETAVVPQAAHPGDRRDLYDQPLLPERWAFEGSAGLFDHSAHEYHTGYYAAAISIPASGSRNPVCVAQANVCQPITPLNQAKDAAAAAASVGPCWRPLMPVGVSAGGVYTVSYWVSWTLATAGTGGAVSKVRWLDGNGVPLTSNTLSAGPSRIATSFSSEAQSWVQVVGTVTAPAGAAKAVPLFCAGDDAFISKVVYDDVFFG